MIGDRLATARKRRGLTQVELAVALGDRYNQQMISHVERGRSSLLADGLIGAAQELGVSTDYLLGLTEDPTPASQRVRGDDPMAVAASRYPHAGHTSESGHLSLNEESPAWGSDAVRIQRQAGLPSTGHGSAVQPRMGSFPVSQDFLAQHQIDPRHARIAQIQGQSMYPALPRGSLVLIDLARKWLKHNLIYLIILNAHTRRAAYEVRRLREDDNLDFHWHTDFYLDLQDGGGAWPARSWRREMWHEEVRGNVITSRHLSEFAPIRNSGEVTVVGQVRGVLHIFDDEGW